MKKKAPAVKAKNNVSVIGRPGEDRLPARPNRQGIAPLYVAAISLILLLALLLWVRLPFLTNPLQGEEGYFGVMAVNDGITKITDYRYFEPHARIQGQVYWDPILHPIGPYLFSTQILRRIFTVDDFLSRSFEEKTRIARIPYLCTFFLALFCVVAIYLRQYQASRHRNLLLMLGLLLFMGMSPFMVGGSIQPQADASVGGLMTAFPALLILVGGNLKSRVLTAGSFISAGLIIGLGRNEWSLALVAALGGVSAFHFFLNRLYAAPGTEQNRPGRAIAWIGTGLLLGNVISYLLDPWDYVQGLYLVFFLNPPSTWWNNFQQIFFFIWPIILLFLFCLGLFAARFRELTCHHFELALIFVYGCALFSGFMCSKWLGDGFPRYFGPAVFTLLCAAAAMLPLIPTPKAVRWGLLGVMLMGSMFHGRTLAWFNKNQLALGSSARRPLTGIADGLQYRHNLFLSTGRPVVAPVTFAYYYPDADFFADILKPEEITNLLRRGVGPRTPEPGPDGKISLRTAWRHQ